MGLLFEICIVDASIFAIVPQLSAVVGGGGGGRECMCNCFRHGPGSVLLDGGVGCGRVEVDRLIP